jgi:hypothetical protein
MTDVSELFPSKFLKAADATPALTLTIARVSQEIMKNQEGEEEVKPVIWFLEQEKGMVLNRTNANTLTALFGSKVETWTNQRVVLGTEIVTAFGATKPALRFKSEEVKYDRASLLARFDKLFNEASELEVPDLDTYRIDDDTPDATLLELGKELRGKVDAAKAF